MEYLSQGLRHACTVLTLAWLVTAFPGAANAQDLLSGSADEPAVSAGDAVPIDPLGRHTPKGTVAGLIAALADSDLARASRFLEGTGGDLSQAPTEDDRAIAERLQSALDRSGSLISPASLSDDAVGQLNDGLPADIERVGSIRDAEQSIEITTRRVDVAGQAIWLISSDTLSQLPEAQDDRMPDDASGLLDSLPAGPVVRGVPLSDWALLVLFGLLSLVVAWAVTRLRRILLLLFRRQSEPSRFSRFIEASEPPLRLFLAAIIFSIGVSYLGVSIVARYQLLGLVELAAWLSGAWFVWRLTDAIGEAALERMSNRGQLTAYSIVSFVSRVAKGILGALILFTALRAMGVDVTAGLAALGVGGLAIALGAQKLFENLIGSMTLIADRPVRVGDFCRFGETLGTVEEIGIRSTRIRTLNRTVVTVPNGEFSALQIENFARRDRFWFHHTLGLRYETSPDQIRYLLQELRAVLYAHPKVDPDPARVRFVNFNAYSLDIEIFAYVHASDYNEYLEIQEDLMLRAMDVVAQSGTGFAFPSQTLYLGRDGGLDAEKTQASEAQVQRWSRERSLQVPRFSQARMTALRDSIVYPPEASAQSRGAEEKA